MGYQYGKYCHSKYVPGCLLLHTSFELLDVESGLIENNKMRFEV